MLSPGTIVGDKYRLEEPIGQGGMATVWRAVHTTLDRPVAVKFLEAVGTGAQQLAERFLQEAKLAAGLRHRHVVDVLDFGVLDTGTPFMVMELLEGQSLADRYTDGPPVSDWELLEIIAMTLSGLAAVHDAGILHRDLKPENIFLVTDADGIFPKLLDFGISRGFGATGRVTRTGVVVGTPQYMSPEQARGKKQLDARSDLFSIGIVLYEGFSGEVPFDSENPGDILISVATEEPRQLEELRPDLPHPVVDLVHRALKKDPALRFQSAREMRDRVMTILKSGDSMTGRPPSTVIRQAYPSAPGSGKLRAVSVRPPAPPVKVFAPPVAKPAPAPKLPAPADAAPARPSPVPARASSPTPTPISPERLPRSRGVASKERSGSGWIVALVSFLIALAGGGYVAYVRGLLPFGTVARAGEGTLRPGVEVPGALVDAGDEREDELSPPSDGASAPPIETVDVPSPPDPPDRAPEEGLAVDDAGPDAGAASGADAGADAGASAAEVETVTPEPTRASRRRAARRRRRPR